MKEVKAFRRITRIVGVLSGFMLVLIIGVFLAAKNPDLLRLPTRSEIKSKINDLEGNFPAGYEGKMVRYGYRLITESSKWMGPNAENPEDRYAGNRLACNNCHLDAGTRAGSASWVGISDRFPQFRGRENKIGTLEERINGCMQRSMNGKAIPEDSDMMQAMISYMDWLSEDVSEEIGLEYKGFTKVSLPDRAVTPEEGKPIYIRECAVCHGEDGQGVRFAGADSVKGYQYPPLWGNDTYNHGAGMHRVITAAQFIKANMPFGQATREEPKLTDEESILVAAYIDSFDRPLKDNPEADFPDKKLKPVSTPYGPWEDEFSAEQHKYGPFKPIMSYYLEEYGIKKSK